LRTGARDSEARGPVSRDELVLPPVGLAATAPQYQASILGGDQRHGGEGLPPNVRSAGYNAAPDYRQRRRSLVPARISAALLASGAQTYGPQAGIPQDAQVVLVLGPAASMASVISVTNSGSPVRRTCGGP